MSAALASEEELRRAHADVLLAYRLDDIAHANRVDLLDFYLDRVLDDVATVPSSTAQDFARSIRAAGLARRLELHDLEDAKHAAIREWVEQGRAETRLRRVA